MDEQNIPIDINTGKLLDWLVSRRHIPKDWQNNVLKVREKINNAIQDMPEHKDIIKLVSGQHINYFHCVKIVEILKETEKDTKNMFGRYGSKRMKDWQEILSLYQKDNIYLAEAASMLIRNVNYEVPGLRKQVQKLQQLQAENEKKIKDCNKSETTARKNFKASCEQIGIKGDDIKNELLDLLKDLPRIYEEIAKKVKVVKPAIELYLTFNQFLSGQDQDFHPLSTLNYLIERGNTTTYEFRYRVIPISIEEFEVVHAKNDSNAANNEIDFGENIDYGGGIDFGNGDIDLGEQIVVQAPGCPTETDSLSAWTEGSSNEESFEIINYDDIESGFKSGIVLDESVKGCGVARGEEALTLLDHPKHREELLDDLYELDAFLKMRLFELTRESDVLSVAQMQDVPAALQMITATQLHDLADRVNVALSQFTDARTQHLHNIKHSPKHVDILSAMLQQTLTVIDRMKAKKKQLEERMTQTALEIRNLEPIIETLIDRSKELQHEIRQDISEKYKGRIVNIVGGVNVL